MPYRFSTRYGLSLCFIGMVAFSEAALAKDPTDYFYPKSKWTVEHVKGGNGSEAKICTISNQLNNGYVVQLAGTQKGFLNLNLNIRKDRFEENKRYEVQYEVPGIAQRVIPTKAYKKNLLVSDLRREGDFVDTMQKNGVLDVRIQQDEFRIYMTGFDAGMENFENCTSSGKVLAESKMTSPASAGEKSGHAQEQSISSAADLSSPSAGEAIEVPEIANGASQENGGYKPQQRARYTEQLAEEIKQESEQYRPEENSRTSAADPKEDESSVSVKEDKPFGKITKEKYSGELDFTKVPPRKPAQVDTIEPSSGQSNVSVIGGDAHDLRMQLAKLKDEIAFLQEQNRSLDEELKIISADGKSEKISVSSSNWNLERATMRLNESERQVLRLGRQLQTERAKCTGEKKDLEMMLFDPQLTDQQQRAKLASLEGELEQSKSELERQRRQYEERISLLEEQINARYR